MNTERWLPVAGYGGKYVVSETGKVKSVFTKSKLGKIRMLGVILKTSVNYRGYEIVKLAGIRDATGKSRKTVKVHRLVCAAFHQNPENKPEVNHKDLNPLNNHFENLEWCTSKENTLHAQLNGKRKVKRIEEPKLRKYKKVVNLKTGEISDTNSVANLLGIKRRYLARKLNETRPNDTHYAYLK